MYFRLIKRLLLILLICPIIGFTQNSTVYKEFNAGVYLGEEILVFPGASFLWGKTIYYNNVFIDYEAGFAFPTVFTGKIGFGVGNENNAIAIGIRPFPTSLYLQYTWSTKRLFSIELMPPALDWTPNADWPLILNYGYRW